MKIWFDGKLVDRSEAKVSVFDHGVLYGDGVFEGIRFYSGRIFQLKEHIRRLIDSARYIMLTIPYSEEELIEACCDAAKASGLSDGYIRLVVTRGEGTLGLNPANCSKPCTFVIADEIALYPQEHYINGLKLITSSFRRPTPEALSPQVKSLNYLNNIMAKSEAVRYGAGEALMLNEAGNVAECTGDNIFMVKNKVVLTPPVTDGALDGITRRVVLQICHELCIETKEVTMNRYDVTCADECFLTGTAAEVIPVAELDARPIADGRPGVITRRILARYQELTHNSGVPF